MRRQLVLGAVAVTAMIVIAFVIPLGVAVRILAANRPLGAAEQTARSLATVVALTDSPQVLEDAVAAAQAGSPAALTVFFPNGAQIGAAAPIDANVQRALQGAAFAAEVPTGRHVFVPAVRANGSTAAVLAAVPGDILRRGVAQSWLLLALLAGALLLVAAALADALGRNVVTPVRALATTAGRLANGDLAARVEPRGPDEIRDVGRTLNTLAGRITELLAAERELVAELSHRLRTPLTALRINAESVANPTDRERLRGDVDAMEATVTGLIREARTPKDDTADALDLRDIVTRSAEYWGALADEQSRTWDLQVPKHPVHVRVARTDAEALLDVLLDNVFTHTPEGTPYRVCLTADTLVVADEGPGPTLPRSTSIPTRSTGMGLDIAERIARRAGGSLEVTAGPSGGTCVEVRWAPPA